MCVYRVQQLADDGGSDLRCFGLLGVNGTEGKGYFLSTSCPYYRRAPTMPWTRRMPEISRAGEVSLSGTSCCVVL